MITEEKDIQQTLVYIASPNPKPRQSCKISINKKSFTWICMQHLLIKCHHHNVAYNANIHVYLKGFSVMNKSNEFLSLPPIAKYNASRSIKQKIAPATSEGVSQETCTHFTCRYMINATSCCIVTFI